MSDFINGQANTGYECQTCEATGYVYIGYGVNDVKECIKCDNGYIDTDEKEVI